MKADTPITLAVAVYADRATAVDDYEAVRHAKRDGEFDHLAIAVLTKDADGHLQVERHDSTAKHLAWGGALLGAGMVIAAPIAAPYAIAVTAGAGGGLGAAGLAGIGGLAGHLWRNVPKEKVREMGDALEAGSSGLLVVAVNKHASDITPLLGHAQKVVIDDTTKGDLDAMYDDAIQKASDLPAS